jgi:hypothetical protein
MGVVAAAPSLSSAVPVAFAVLAASSTASVTPPVLVPSVRAMLHSRSLYTVVAPLVPSALLVPARLRTTSHSAWAPAACKDPFSLPLYPGVSPSPGAAPHDAPLP